MEEIKVISSEVDGAALRREKRQTSRHLRCDGKADDAEINEALQSKGPSWALPAEAWERVFGGSR